MTEWLSAYGIGAVSGARSMLGPALALHATAQGPRPLRGTSAGPAWLPVARSMMFALAAGEMLADKSPRIGARTDVLPLSGRAVSGALSAAACARAGRRVPMAIAGALGAVSAAYALVHLRRMAGRRLRLPDAVVGLVEDGLVLSAGLRLVRSR